MSHADERALTLRRARQLLAELISDGVDIAPRTPKAAPAKRPPELAPAFRPRVAPLAAPATLSAAARSQAAQLDEVRSELGECTRCKLSERRTTIVFGEGSNEARVVFVGEGPGEEEDKSGRPFVGRAGELLTKMIAAVGWRREDVYICNIVKCRPPGNRDPAPEEIASCSPFLVKQLLAIRPLALVALGRPATSTLLGRPIAISKLRGHWLEWQGIPLMPTYHPAYLLRNYTKETRQAVWDDLRAVRERIDAATPS